MTGFASVEGDGVSLTIKGVNHRFLDLSLRLPPGCDGVEAAIRRAVKERVRRGHVDVTVQMVRREAVAAGLEVNRELLTGHLQAFKEAAEACGVVGAEPDVNALLRVPGMLRTAMVSVAEHCGDEVLNLLPELLERFDAARALEGSALAEELRAGMGRLARLTAEARELCAGVRAALVERLRGRMAEVLSGAAISEERVLAEAALLADRSDVEEELVRLEIHTARFMAMLDEGGELGKQLDFLLQELNREANTLLSKTAGAAGLPVTELGLAMKVEIERAKEQVQNLE